MAEQLVGSLYLDFRNGLNWTPFENFRQRDRGGWDVTVPATAFRGIEARTVDETVERLNRGINRCSELVDAGTRELLEHILDGEEAHADWLETQLGLISQLGEANYLAQQLRS